MARQTILAHLDDVGVSSGSVVAWKALRAAGVVNSASVMVPCPWYRAAVDDWHSQPDQDLGVHITLTSEWSTYRWRPLIGPVAGLTDDEGFFHRRPDSVVQQADPAAVADEIAAQIERALEDGIRPTHLDVHMGTAFLPPFARSLVDASERYDIPLMVCRDFAPLIEAVGLAPLDVGYLTEIIQEFDARGARVFDRFLIGFCPDTMDTREHFARILAEGGPGRHWLALHANAPDDTRAFAPQTAVAREKEYAFFSRADSKSLFAEADSQTRNWLTLD